MLMCFIVFLCDWPTERMQCNKLANFFTEKTQKWDDLYIDFKSSINVVSILENVYKPQSKSIANAQKIL